jgi:hypothetical protein
MVSDEELQKYHEKATLQNVLKGGKNQGQNSIAQEILAQDQYKQEIIDGLLGVRRTKKPMETEDGQLYLQEFVRLEDQSGRWFKLSDISDERWKKIKKNGPIQENGAKAVLTTLNGIANNNVSMSNLTQTQINKIGEQAVRSIDNKLRSNRESYGIQSTQDLEWIMTNIINPNVMGGLNKAKNGKFIKELLSQTNLVGSLDDEEEDNGGILASFQN